MTLFATVALTTLLSAILPSPGTTAQTPIPESRPVTITARIEAVDRENRIVRLRRPGGETVDVEVPADMEGFRTLKAGDVVSATYSEAIAVRVRKPGDQAPAAAPSTSTQRKAGTPGSETRREQTFPVTVTAIDTAAPSITVKGPKGNVKTMAVRDPKQLQGVKVGDTIDVTYYESLLVKIGRPEKE
jgi:hypothetical protein